MKVTGTAAAPLVNLFKDFFLGWIKDEVISAIVPLLTDLFPNSINGMDALKAALTDLPGDFQLDWQTPEPVTITDDGVNAGSMFWFHKKDVHDPGYLPMPTKEIPVMPYKSNTHARA